MNYGTGKDLLAHDVRDYEERWELLDKERSERAGACASPLIVERAGWALTIGPDPLLALDLPAARPAAPLSVALIAGGSGRFTHPANLRPRVCGRRSLDRGRPAAGSGRGRA